MVQTSAIAHPNIALVKYWGKVDIGRNLPAVGSISITLDRLFTKTRVTFDPGFDDDQFVLGIGISFSTPLSVPRILNPNPP
jgi:mevalonate pyrophosphate decarboxylase